MTMMEKIYTLCTLGLMLINLVLLVFTNVYGIRYGGKSLGYSVDFSTARMWIGHLVTILLVTGMMTLCLAVLGKFTSLLSYLYVICANGLCLVLFLLKCIVGREGADFGLTAGGIFVLIFMAGAVATSVLLYLEKRKNG